MKTKKTFDCVEMKRKAAEKLYKQINKMTMEEEVLFWHKGQSNLYKMIVNTRK